MREKTENTHHPKSYGRIFFGRGVIIAASLALFYGLAGFFLAPYLVKRYVPQLVQEHLQRDMRIGEVRINPFLFTFAADNVLLSEKDTRPIAGFDELFVDFELSSLFRWALTFRHFELVKPIVNLVFAPDGALNLAQIVSKSETPPTEADSEPLRILLDTIAIKQGEINITDHRQATPATVKISPLDLELNNISTLPEKKGPYTLTAATDDGTKLKWTGEVFLNPFRSTGSLAFENVQAATVYEFVSDAINIAPPEGYLHVSTDYQIDFSPVEPQLTLSRLSVRLSDLALKLDGGTNSFLNIGTTELNDARFDLAARQLEIERVALSGGAVRMAVDEKGTLDLQRIIKSTPANEKPTPQLPQTDKGSTAVDKNGPWKVKISNVEIDGIALAYRDGSIAPASAAGIDTVKLNFSIEAEAGPDQTNLRAQNMAVSLDNVHAGLEEVAEPLIRVDTLVLQDGAFDLLQRAFTVSRVGFEGGHIILERDASGEVNLLHLIAPPESRTLQRQSEEAAAKGEPWQFSAKTVEFSGLTTSISDRALKPDGQIFLIDPLNISLSDVDGRSPMGFNLDLKIREGGGMTASGTFDPAGPAVESEVNVDAVALTPFQPIVDAVANIVLHSGTFSSRGKLTYGHKSAGADLAYNGGFNLSQLRITEPDSKDTLLGWKALSTDQLKLNLQPNRVDIRELRLSQPVAKLIIHEDGSVNLANVMKDRNGAAIPEKGGAAKDAKNGSFPVSVKKVRVDNASLDFADLTLTPQFGTKIEALSGVIAGMASSRNARAQVDLEGKVDQYGQAKIGGEINAFDPVGFTDISMIFHNIEMSSLTPYSGKFAGRIIDSGKLSLDLEYKIDNGQLLGDHKIVVDRIKLGQNVDSPDAPNLPLDLAIALMEDTNGVIDIGLPVRGDLNNPEFSYGHLIGQALFNLITKIVTAPFRVLGGMIPGGSDDLDTVLFEPGEYTLSPPEKEKIKKLAEALQQRPQLTLEIQGRYSAESDGSALNDISVRRLLTAQLGTTLAPDEKPDPVDFGSPETQKALTSMYRERFGASELKKLEKSIANQPDEGANSKSPSARGEDPGALSKAAYTRLVESESLEKSTLNELAAARGQAIVEELTTEGGISPDQVTFKEPGAVPDGKPVSAMLSLAVAGKS